MRFWNSSRWLASRLLSCALVSATILNAAAAFADVAHFYNGKTLRGKLGSVSGDIIEFKRGLFRTQVFTRLMLTNRRDVVEMKDFQKFFGEIIYADGGHVEIMTKDGHTRLNRFLIKNIVLATPGQLPVDIPTSTFSGSLPENKPVVVMPGSMTETSQRIPVQPSTFLFPPPSTPSEDLDAINTDDRIP